jgi:hypothetical protein
MVEIECLECDKVLVLPQFINTNNYDGQVVCHKCKALLYIKLVNNEVRKYKIIERIRKGTPIKVSYKFVDVNKEPS